MAQKIAIFGKTPESKSQLKKEIENFGFKYDEKKPDIVISYGGDGTFLWSEREYPGVPKALFRYSKICKKCHNLPIDHALALIKNNNYKIETYPKLQAGKLLATNDIVIRNSEPTHAIRFELEINGEKLSQEFIGDGIVIATAFGSTGYFHSITRKSFSEGIGIAFNNTTTHHEAIILPEKIDVILKLTRGTAVLAADNNPKIKLIKKGEKIRIKTSNLKANTIAF